MSAAGYTNRIRTKAEARVRKVQYKFSDASNYNPLASTCNANPDYTILNYVENIRCDCIILAPLPPPPPVRMIYNGGNAFSNIYYGGSAFDVYTNILNGNVSTGAQILNGGNALTTDIPLFFGGDSLSNFVNILNGGNSTL